MIQLIDLDVKGWHLMTTNDQSFSFITYHGIVLGQSLMEGSEQKKLKISAVKRQKIREKCTQTM